MSAKPEPDTSSAGEFRRPRHVAIIMDGNGRWAQTRGLPRREGHRRGVEAVKRAVRYAGENNIDYLTLFSFSSENWSRPRDEVEDLMNLLRYFIRRDLDDLSKEDMCVKVIGSRERVPADILAMIEETERKTAGNKRLTLIVAFNYGSRDEIARAAAKIAVKIAEGEMSAESVSVETLGTFLDTCGIPDPDLIIRTSGEQRISNFLLWQAAYSELLFLPIYWPDFSDHHFEEALKEYSARDRRYGGVRSG